MTIPRHRPLALFESTGLTHHCLSDLLTAFLTHVSHRQAEQVKVVLASWAEVMGPQLTHMTEAVSFEEGVLYIKVKNTTLHSLLIQQDKKRLLQLLRKKNPHVEIKTIYFRIG